MHIKQKSHIYPYQYALYAQIARENRVAEYAKQYLLVVFAFEPTALFADSCYVGSARGFAIRAFGTRKAAAV